MKPGVSVPVPPTDEDVRLAVDDAEAALAEFSLAFTDGTLGALDVDSADQLITRASSSVRVAENAFGVDSNPDDTPDALKSRLFDVYADQCAMFSLSDRFRRSEEALAQAASKEADAVKTRLNLNDDDIARLDFDRQNGDISSWLMAQERSLVG